MGSFFDLVQYGPLRKLHVDFYFYFFSNEKCEFLEKIIDSKKTNFQIFTYGLVKILITEKKFKIISHF